MSLLYQRFVSPVVDLDATTSLLVIPITGSCKIVEFGAVGTDTAGAGATLVVSLEHLDAGGNAAVSIATATGTAAVGIGDTLRRLCDVFVDKANAKYVVSGTETSDTDGIGYFRVRVTTAGAANSNGCLYAVVCDSGSTGAAAATGEVIVTS